MALLPLIPDSDSDEETITGQEDHQPTNYFEQFCSLLADYTTEIWLLKGSYQDFQQEYGFLCGHVEFSSMFPLPHQINDYLFLGSRVIPLDGTSLAQLCISHMIVSDKQALKWEGLKGIEVLHCSVEESNSQNMTPCWEASCSFIEEALGRG